MTSIKFRSEMGGKWRESVRGGGGGRHRYGVIVSESRMALCLPVELSWWGLFSEPAALSPWRPGCGWWQSKISLSSADGAWRRSACAWSSASEGRPAGPGPSGRCRSRYSLGGQRAERRGGRLTLRTKQLQHSARRSVCVSLSDFLFPNSALSSHEPGRVTDPNQSPESIWYHSNQETARIAARHFNVLHQISSSQTQR